MDSRDECVCMYVYFDHSRLKRISAISPWIDHLIQWWQDFRTVPYLVCINISWIKRAMAKTIGCLCDYSFV